VLVRASFSTTRKPHYKVVFANKKKMPDNWKKRPVIPCLPTQPGHPDGIRAVISLTSTAARSPRPSLFVSFDFFTASLADRWRLELAHLVDKEAQVERRKGLRPISTVVQ